MSFIQDIKSWIWVIISWILVYFTLLLSGVLIGIMGHRELYWLVYLIGVPLLIAPITYRRLVGGGCSLRFHICALVKGALVGMILFFVTAVVDPYLWSYLQYYVGWNALTLSTFTSLIYQIWFFAGIAGGFAARIVEVRQFESMNDIPMIIRD